MQSFFKGQHLNTKMNQLSAQVSRLVLCGDNATEDSLVDVVQRGSYRTAKQNKKFYKNLGETYSNFEAWLTTFIDKIDIDLMPGSQDFSTAYLP